MTKIRIVAETLDNLSQQAEAVADIVDIGPPSDAGFNSGDVNNAWGDVGYGLALIQQAFADDFNSLADAASAISDIFTITDSTIAESLGN